jgi:predicted DNA-binding transcriptional regulator YafY
MLELLSLLQLHRFWRGPELADRLDVSQRTLRRDVDRLRGLGYVIESLPGLAGGYQMTSGATLPPMVFTDSEAVALAIGLRDVAHGADPVTAEASVRALAKLTAILPANVRQRVDVLREVIDSPSPHRLDTPDAQVLGAVAQACNDSVRLRFGYRPYGVAIDAEPDDRYVEPYRLVPRSRRWYLVAFDLDRSDWRTFRLDRVSDPAPARNQFSPRPLPASDLQRYVADGIASLRPQHTVVFEVVLGLEEAQARLGHWATVAAAGGTRSRVTLTVEDLDWAVFMMMSLGVEVTAMSPELRRHVDERQRLLTNAATGPPAELTA